MEEMISQEEIDALLGGKQEKEPPKDVPKHIEDAHTNNQAFIKAARQEILKVMETLNAEGQGLLHTIQSLEEDDENNITAQHLLGNYYEFLNECHAKLNHLDDLARRETSLYQRRVKLGV